jgi:FAD/FMN-containing dehydrogenase
MTLAAVEEQGMEIEAALERIKSVVGPRGWIAEADALEPYLVEARRLYRGTTQDGEIELMRRIKRALDPHNIMNPGKVVIV